jgi:hypothetical protein
MSSCCAVQVLLCLRCAHATQLRARDEEVAGLSAVASGVQGTYERRLAELEERAARLAAANKQLEARR